MLNILCMLIPHIYNYVINEYFHNEGSQISFLKYNVVITVVAYEDPQMKLMQHI